MFPLVVEISPFNWLYSLMASYSSLASSSIEASIEVWSSYILLITLVRAS